MSLLARQFLVGPEPAPAKYAYYCYLIFADKSSKAAAARRAAAQSYLRLLENVVEVEKSTHVRPANMAVMLAPVLTKRDARDVLEKPDPQLLVDRYNYARAREIFNVFNRVGTSLPLVSIVASPTPLDGTFVGKATIVDLELQTEQQIDDRFSLFRTKLEAGKMELGLIGEPPILKGLRELFQYLGAFVVAVEKAS